MADKSVAAKPDKNDVGGDLKSDEIKGSSKDTGEAKVRDFNKEENPSLNADDDTLLGRHHDTNEKSKEFQRKINDQILS